MDLVIYQQFPPDCIIFDNWVFENLISVDELSVKALRIFETCLSINNNLWGKLVSSLESRIIFGDNLKTTYASFFIAEINLFNCELIISHLNYCIESF